MNYIHFFFLFQCAIICRQYIFSNAKALFGENVEESKEEQFPFIVSISKNTKTMIPEYHLCTGALLTKKHVLTAAHCKTVENVKQFCVLAGSHDLTKAKKYKIGVWLTYLQWILNTTKRMESVVTDVSLIALCKRVQFEFEPARISNTEVKHLYGTDVVVAGWSFNSNNTMVNQFLTFGLLKIIDPRDCQTKIEKHLKEKYKMYETILCTSADPYILVNYGVSGGPLLDTNNVILGVNQGRIPKSVPRSVDKDHVNIHIGVYHYRQFIADFLQKY